MSALPGHIFSLPGDDGVSQCLRCEWYRLLPLPDRTPLYSATASLGATWQARKPDCLMRLAIVGSRDFPDLELVRAFVGRLSPRVVVVTGGARGVDAIAAEAARDRGLDVEVLAADWERHGPSAGPRRNTKVVFRADRIVCFWDGSSNGTRDVILKARLAKKALLVVGPRAAAEKGT